MCAAKYVYLKYTSIWTNSWSKSRTFVHDKFSTDYIMTTIMSVLKEKSSELFSYFMTKHKPADLSKFKMPF